ncbi:MAG: hypothetical protein ACP5IV_07420 [Caldisericia bacterium]
MNISNAQTPTISLSSNIINFDSPFTISATSPNSLGVIVINGYKNITFYNSINYQPYNLTRLALNVSNLLPPGNYTAYVKDLKSNLTSNTISFRVLPASANPSITLSGHCSGIYNGQPCNITAEYETANQVLNATLYLNGNVFEQNLFSNQAKFSSNITQNTTFTNLNYLGNYPSNYFYAISSSYGVVPGEYGIFYYEKIPITSPGYPNITMLDLYPVVNSLSSNIISLTPPYQTPYNIFIENNTVYYQNNGKIEIIKPPFNSINTISQTSNDMLIGVQNNNYYYGNYYNYNNTANTTYIQLVNNTKTYNIPISNYVKITLLNSSSTSNTITKYNMSYRSMLLGGQSFYQVGSTGYFDLLLTPITNSTNIQYSHYFPSLQEIIQVNLGNTIVENKYIISSTIPGLNTFNGSQISANNYSTSGIITGFGGNLFSNIVGNKFYLYELTPSGINLLNTYTFNPKTHISAINIYNQTIYPEAINIKVNSVNFTDGVENVDYSIYGLQSYVAEYIYGINSSIRSAGNYTLEFKVNGNAYYLSNTITKNVYISKISPIINLTVCSNYTYNGMPCNLTASISTYKNQLAGNLYINGKIVRTTTTNLTYPIASAGNYIITFNTTGNQNYISNTITKMFSIYKASPNLNLTICPNSIYGNTLETNCNITATMSNINNQLTGTINFNIYPLFNNNTPNYRYSYWSMLNYMYSKSYKNPIWNLITPFSSNEILPAGLYKFVFYTNGNQNYTAEQITKNFTIYLATPNVTFNVCSNFTYNGSYCHISATVNSINNQVKGNIYLNNKLVASNSPIVSYSTATAGNYIVNLTTSDEQTLNGMSYFSNYVTNTITKRFSIYKATPSIKITTSPSQSFTYNSMPISVNINISTYKNQLPLSLYVNNVLIGSTYTSNTFIIPGSAGVYSFVANTLGNTNYTANSVSANSITIYKATPKLTLNVCQNYTYNGVGCTINASISTISNQLIGSLYLNNNFISNTTTTTQYTTQSNAGIYNINFTTLGNVNYTANSITKTFEIYKSPSISSTMISSISPISNNTWIYNPNLTFTFTTYGINNSILSERLVLSNGETFNSISAPITIKNLTQGLYYANVINLNPNYINYSKTYIINISKMIPKVSIEIPANVYNGYNYFNFNTYNGVLANLTLTMTSPSTQTFTYNSVSTESLHLGAGKYQYTIQTIPNAYYISKTFTGNFTINKGTPFVVIKNVTRVYNGTSQEIFTYNVYSFNNQVSAVVFLNGLRYTVGKNGSIYVKYPGEYDLELTTASNQNYTSITKWATAYVEKQTPSYTISNTIFTQNLTSPNYLTISTTIPNSLITDVYMNGNYIANFTNSITITKDMNQTGNYTFKLVGNPINSSLTNSVTYYFTVKVLPLPPANFTINCPKNATYGYNCTINVISFSSIDKYIELVNPTTGNVIMNITKTGTYKLPYTSAGNYSYEIRESTVTIPLKFTIQKAIPKYFFYYSSPKLTGGKLVSITSDILNLGNVDYLDFPINITAIIEVPNFQVMPIFYYNGKLVNSGISKISILGNDYIYKNFSVSFDNYHPGLNYINFTSTSNQNYTSIDPVIEFNVTNGAPEENKTIIFQNNTYNNSYFKIYIPNIWNNSETYLYYNYTPVNPANKTALYPADEPKKNATYLIENLTYTFLTKSNQTPTVYYKYNNASAGVYVFKVAIVHNNTIYYRLFYETYYRAIPNLNGVLYSNSTTYPYGENVVFNYNGKATFYVNSTNLNDGSTYIYGNKTMLNMYVDNTLIGTFPVNDTFSFTLYKNDTIKTSLNKTFNLGSIDDVGLHNIELVVNSSRNITYAETNKIINVTMPVLNFDFNKYFIPGYDYTYDLLHLYELYNPDILKMFINNSLVEQGYNLSTRIYPTYYMIGNTIYNFSSSLNYPFGSPYVISISGIDTFFNITKNGTISIWKPFIYEGNIINYSINSSIFENSQALKIIFYNLTSATSENGIITNGNVSVSYGNKIKLNSTEVNLIALKNEGEYLTGNFNWISDGHSGIYNFTNILSPYTIVITYGHRNYTIPLTPSWIGVDYVGGGVWLINSPGLPIVTGPTSTPSPNSSIKSRNTTKINCNTINSTIGKLLYNCTLETPQPYIDIVINGTTFRLNIPNSTSSKPSVSIVNSTTTPTTICLYNTCQTIYPYTPPSNSSTTSTTSKNKTIEILPIGIENITKSEIPTIIPKNGSNQIIFRNVTSFTNSTNTTKGTYQPINITTSYKNTTTKYFCVYNNCFEENDIDWIYYIIIGATIGSATLLTFKYLKPSNNNIHKNKKVIK